MTGKSDHIFDWSVGFVLLMLGVFTASLIPQERWNWSVRRLEGAVAWIGGGLPRTFDHPEALIVSRQAGDRFAVSSTLEPRGYQVHVVADREAALAEIRQHSRELAVIVVDDSLPEGRKTLAEAGKICPDACPILLKGHREPAQIAQILVEAMDHHLTAAQARELQQESRLQRETGTR